MKNPQFMFSLTDPDPYDDRMTCPLIISLAQKVKERKTEHAIGFRIYKVGQSFGVRNYRKVLLPGPSWYVPPRC